MLVGVPGTKAHGNIGHCPNRIFCTEWQQNRNEGSPNNGSWIVDGRQQGQKGLKMGGLLIDIDWVGHAVQGLRVQAWLVAQKCSHCQH